MILLLLAFVLAVPWQPGAPLPEPRTEVAGAALRGEIVVLGGLTESGAPSARVDAYSPALDSWRPLPDLPEALHHTMVASDGKRLYVAGGYGIGFRDFRRGVYAYDGRVWTSLPRLPVPRAAGGAAIVRGKLYVVGGVEAGGLARDVFVLDLATRRWSLVPGPVPREHLAVTAAGGFVYALAGRKAGIDTNLRTFQVFTPATRRWRTLSPVPTSRGGTGAAVAGGMLVSAGGEEPTGTIASVYGYDLARGRWSQLSDLATPRHGLAVVALGGVVYAIGGGPQPGLTVSDVNESLDLG